MNVDGDDVAGDRQRLPLSLPPYSTLSDLIQLCVCSKCFNRDVVFYLFSLLLLQWNLIVYYSLLGETYSLVPSHNFIPSFIPFISFPVSTVTAPVVAPTPVPAPAAESSASSFSTSFQHSSVPEEEYRERVSKLRKVLVEGKLLSFQLSFLRYRARCCRCCCCCCYKERWNVSSFTCHTFDGCISITSFAFAALFSSSTHYIIHPFMSCLILFFFTFFTSCPSLMQDSMWILL
jgi:hypothetical protein